MSALDSFRPFPTLRPAQWLAGWLTVLVAVLLLLPPAARAAATDAAKLYEQMGCAECHGADGRTTQNDFTPIVAGQKKSYAYQALKAYKSGARSAAQHSEVSDLLNDAQMKALAEYMSKLK